MAKKKKTDVIGNLKKADDMHGWNVERYVKDVDRLYQQAVARLSVLAASIDGIPEDQPFSFRHNKAVEKEVDKTIQELASRITAGIERGARNEWIAACAKSNQFIESILQTTKLTRKTLQGYQDRNLEALAAFQVRKVDGLGLSDRVWKYVAPVKDEVEAVVDTSKKYYKHGINSGKSMTKMDRALGTGMSAAELSREIRSCLKEPNKLFRRIKDKYGNLHLSKNAKLYHPGQGVYRSSYKNAMRMTRSEINMAYRQSDYLRWQQLDFVVGIRVQLSGNHTSLGRDGKPHEANDLCNLLAGDYPKDFKFVGWHPQCRCIATPIMKPYDEWNEDRSHLNDKNYRQMPASNEVTEAPKGFSNYIRDNQKRIAGWSSTPYYIKDNPQWVDRALHPEKYAVKALVLDPDMKKQLEDFRMYSYNHQGSKLFKSALDDALIAQQKGNQKAFDEAMARMAAIQKKNEASTASKARNKALAKIEKELSVEDILSADLATFTSEQVANIKEIEKAIKQKKGLRMSYEEANTGKENPNFKEKFIPDPKGEYKDKHGNRYRLNPDWKDSDSGYTVNCQTCTLIHELRRRGFNVEAVTNYRKKVWKIYEKNGVGSKQQGYRIGKWLDSNGTPVGPTYAYEHAAKNGTVITSKSDVEKFFEDYSKGKDGRFEIYVDWKGGSAHVFCAERKDGKWVFFDPQSAKKDVWDEYARKGRLHRFGIIRTDDKLINPKLAETFIAKGELPVVVGKKTRAEEIADIAKKRHDARTEEQKKKLTDFWAKRKEETKNLRKELSNIINSAKDIEDAGDALKNVEDILVGNKGAVTTKAGKTATASMEKLRNAAKDVKTVVDEYNSAMSEAKALVSDFKGIKGVDTETVLKAKSINGVKTEIKKLEQRKKEIIDEAISLKKDFDGVKDLDMKVINNTINSGKLSSIQGISDKIREIKRAEEAISDLIPNVHELHKSYSLSELQTAHKELDEVLSKWLSKYSYSSIDNAPLGHLKNKLDFELSSPTFRYSNKAIIERAINEKIAIINQKIEWDNLVSQVASLKSFDSKAKTYKDLLSKVEDAVNSNDFDALKKSIAAAEAEQQKILEKRLKNGSKTALNPEYKGGAVGQDLSSTINVSTMRTTDSYEGEKRYSNEVARLQGFDSPAKLVTEAEFDMLEKNCGEVFYRTVNPTTFRGKDMTSQEFASQIYVAKSLEMNGGGGRVYGDGMYVATSAWDGDTMNNLTQSRKQHAYRASVAYGYGSHTCLEMTFTRKPKIIKQTDLRSMWNKLTPVQKSAFGNHLNTYGIALGYDAMVTTRDYMVIWNRSIIAVKKK